MIKEFQGQYRWLSNFWYCEVEFDGIKYPTVEHAYQAAKCLKPLDRQFILHDCPKPGDAKRAGRKLKIRPDWEEMKLANMFNLLKEKFKNPDLRKKLLNTGNEHLQEGNMWGDRFWGVDLKTNQGKNWLGVLLMKVRDEIRKEIK